MVILSFMDEIPSFYFLFFFWFHTNQGEIDYKQGDRST
jgi:hypothetical protein